MTTLAIDFGNTRTKIGIFDEEQLVDKLVFDQLSLTQLNELLTNLSVQQLIYTSVVRLEAELTDFFEQQNWCLQLTPTLKLPFENQYTTPHTLGRDRIAAVAGAVQLFPAQNCLIIDAGTCITYDFLKAGKIYEGGNIAPGLKMRLRAMHEFTAALPLVEVKPIGQKIGNSTTMAIKNGGLWGAVLEMDGIISWAKTDYQQLKVILTGGDSNFFANHLKSKIFAHPDLVLIGLNKILRNNAI